MELNIDEPRQIVIVGAGVAGLTAAIALARAGLNVVLLEKESEISEQGAGVQLAPNAYRVLHALGLGEALNEASFAPEGIDIYSKGNLKPLTRIHLGETAWRRYSAPYLVAHRADLVGILWRAARRLTNITTHFDVSFIDVVQHKRGTTVLIERENGAQMELHPAAVIGADGVNSHIRRKFLNGPAPKFTKYVAWRALLSWDDAASILAMDATSLHLDKKYHFVTYPLPHHKVVNCALFTKERKRTTFGKGLTKPRIGNNALRRSPMLARICEMVGENWTYWPLSSVTVKKWYKGDICLIGDAAHAMLPFQAQGAAMAIEDAWILAQALKIDQPSEFAFAQVQKKREARVAETVKAGQTNARAFHLDPPFSTYRDWVLRHRSAVNQLKPWDWIYEYDATKERFKNKL